MKKLFKNLALTFVAVMLLTALCAGVFSANARTDDPADSYVVQTAPNEDSSLNLWFEHSFKKVFTSDTTPSGMNTYSAYMGKNEVENIQFVLHSASTKAGMSATVTNFTNENGDSIPAELYYEMYVTTSNLREEFVLGMNAENSIIREGETPDPVYPLAKIGGRFQLNAGKSQAFFIKLRSAEDTPSGWYSAQLDIMNSSGQVVKTATVFCYVWDFVIEEETALKTSFILSNNTTFGGNYQKFYDYLLDNRLLAMDIPGALNSDNPYVTNPRVNAIRVTAQSIEGKPGTTYGDANGPVSYSAYPDAYSELSGSDIWEDVKDKFYFYTADEPVGDIWAKWTGTENPGVDEIENWYKVLEQNWVDAKSVVPYHENHPIPYYEVTSSVKNYATEDVMDATQGLIEGGGVSIWCPQFYAFTPQSELTAAGYKGLEGEPIRELSCSISDLWSFGENNSPTGTIGVDFFVGHGYFNWNDIYGEFSDRIHSEVYLANQKGETANSELWAYSAGWNKTYTYCNHLIESTGLQTKMLFWQLFQNDVTGYLYYGTNNWGEYEGEQIDLEEKKHIDNTVTGSNTMCEWDTNKHIYAAAGHSIYGNGLLFYGASQARMRGVADYVGSLRVELMRDGIEEYQMLTMLEDYLGEKAAKDVVARVSTNVVRYLSLPGFDRSAFGADMDEYDIMAMVRRDLGNTLEAAVTEGKCDHEWDEGKVAVEADCLTVGYTVYSCTKCDAEYDEVIPTKHSVGDCFVKVSGTDATCETAGDAVYQCTLCGYRKGVETPAFHDDAKYYRYELYSAKAHDVFCTVCSARLDPVTHTFFTVDTATCTEGGQMMDICRYCGYETLPTDDNDNPLEIPTEAKGHVKVETTVESTCTTAGYTGIVCKNCDYSETTSLPLADHKMVPLSALPATCTEDGKEVYMCVNCEYTETTVIKAPGHSFAEGSCTVCGEADPDYSENVIRGDLNGDGKVNSIDTNVMKRLMSGASTGTDEQNKAADVNGDGKVNSYDTNRLKRYIAGQIDEL